MINLDYGDFCFLLHFIILYDKIILPHKLNMGKNMKSYFLVKNADFLFGVLRILSKVCVVAIEVLRFWVRATLVARTFLF